VWIPPPAFAEKRGLYFLVEKYIYQEGRGEREKKTRGKTRRKTEKTEREQRAGGGGLPEGSEICIIAFAKPLSAEWRMEEWRMREWRRVVHEGVAQSGA
jgi:hypothetical protein